MAASLLTSIADAIREDESLAAAFGHAGWLHLAEAPRGSALPVAIMAGVGSRTEVEPTAARHDRWRVELRSVQIAAYASGPDTAARLVGLMADAIEAAALDGRVLWTGGTVADVARNGVEQEGLDPDRGPDGADVWFHLIELEAMAGRS
jgi:hypothetical protein